MKKNLFVLFLCLCTSFSTFAQLSLLVSGATGQPGQVVEVGIRLVGFEGVASMQFSVNWDSTVLAFDAIENLTTQLPDFTDQQIGLAETAVGAIRVAWFDNTLRGVTLPDSTQLFTLKFRIIGEPGVSSSVSVTNTPISIEFTSADSRVLEVDEIIDGVIVIPGNSTSITYLEALNGMQLHQNEPNPFNTSTNIKLYFSTNEPSHFFVSDAKGAIVYDKLFDPLVGEYIINISRAILGSPGIYYYTVQSGNYHLSKKMILLPE